MMCNGLLPLITVLLTCCDCYNRLSNVGDVLERPLISSFIEFHAGQITLAVFQVFWAKPGRIIIGLSPWNVAFLPLLIGFLVSVVGKIVVFHRARQPWQALVVSGLWHARKTLLINLLREMMRNEDKQASEYETGTGELAFMFLLSYILRSSIYLDQCLVSISLHPFTECFKSVPIKS